MRGALPSPSPSRPGVAEAGAKLPLGVVELGPEPRLAQVSPSVPSGLPRPSVCLAKSVESSCGDRSVLGPQQGPCLKPHAVSSQEAGAEGQDDFMFSCRLRVELVAAGSRSPAPGPMRSAYLNFFCL